MIDSVFRDRLRNVSTLGPETEATVAGRLQMGDFSPAALRCRIDTFAGSVLADFGDELRDSVLDAMDQMVMATGTAEMQPDGSTVRVLHLSALERLPSARMSPLATLQREQRVAPVRDIAELRGNTEEGDDFGLFMKAISSARGAPAIRANCSLQSTMSPPSLSQIPSNVASAKADSRTSLF